MTDRKLMPLIFDIPGNIAKKLRIYDAFARAQQAMPDPILKEAADEIERLQRDLDGARKDAERYRLLRDNYTTVEYWYDEEAVPAVRVEFAGVGSSLDDALEATKQSQG